MNIKFYYIYHSAFAIETDELILIIDYFKDSNQDKQKGIVYSKLLSSPKKLYVLSTHIHHDHFTPEIFEWKAIHPNIQFILSKDILESDECCSKDEAIFLGRGEQWSNPEDELTIEAYGSTDAGVSYAIKLKDKHIFHAGDLNNWHWKDESTKEYAQEAEEFYLRELDFLKKQHNFFDLVMFPVDQRMKTDYFLGAKQFVKSIKVHYFAPMHFDQHYDEANAFSGVAQEQEAKFIKISHPGEEFDIKL